MGSLFNRTEMGNGVHCDVIRQDTDLEKNTEHSPGDSSHSDYLTTILGPLCWGHFPEGKDMGMRFKRATNARSVDEKQPGGHECEQQEESQHFGQELLQQG